MAVALRFPQFQPTVLLGREIELDAIEQQLGSANVRLLSLVGPAGVGKTRLAQEAMARLADRFADGVSFVDLSRVRQPQLVLPAIAKALGLLDSGPGPLLAWLQEHLRDRSALLVLDNFEHVLTAGAETARLLGAAPNLRILVTSRSPLRLRWERTLRIRPLAVPDRDSALAVDELMKLPSVALFVDRAQAQRPDFIPTERQAPALVQLVRQLDGLPLAIELAAANMNALPLAVIARTLHDRVHDLHWDAQDLPDRQRSVHATVGWSYELLSVPEQQLFRRLGVFVGQVSLHAIQAVMFDWDEARILNGLVALAEKSLIVPVHSEANDAEPSFRMLETVRQFAHELLERQGELEPAGRAHARYFVELAQQVDPALRRRGQAAWYFRVEAEHDNLRAAIRWLMDHDEPERALLLSEALGYFWWTYGYHGEGWRWLDEALRSAPGADPIIRARALARAGTLLMYGGDLERAKVVLEESVSLARAHSMRSVIALPLGHLGLRAALAGDLTASLQSLQEARSSAEEQHDQSQVGFTLAALGYRSLVKGDHAQAAELYSTSVAQFLALGNEVSATVVGVSLAVAMQQLRKPDQAVYLLQNALRTTLALKNRWLLSHALEATVSLIGDTADAVQRASLLGALDTLTQATGARYGTLARVTGEAATHGLPPSEEERLEHIRRRGRSIPFSEVVKLALGMLEDFARTLDPSRPAVEEVGPERALSPREEEVLRLVAEGLTSKQIGRQLFLSPRTVDHHLYMTFNKLGVESRAQAIAVAARQHLL